MKFILGEKQSMTQFFAEDGTAHAATVVKATPAVVTAIKTQEKDGYDAVQVGYGARKEKNIAKPQQGQFGKLGNFHIIKEFRMTPEQIGEMKVGDTIDLSTFAADDAITVTGTSKGKGFQGVVKRYNFAGGRRSHGQKHSEREPGSIGATGPARVFKGTRMAGRMGSDRVTVKGLKVLAVDVANNIMLVKGAVPGRRGTVLEIVSK
jgi:large subunit ribosomal protein L3